MLNEKEMRHKKKGISRKRDSKESVNTSQHKSLNCSPQVLFKSKISIKRQELFFRAYQGSELMSAKGLVECTRELKLLYHKEIVFHLDDSSGPTVSNKYFIKTTAHTQQ